MASRSMSTWKKLTNANIKYPALDLLPNKSGEKEINNHLRLVLGILSYMKILIYVDPIGKVDHWNVWTEYHSFKIW